MTKLGKMRIGDKEQICNFLNKLEVQEWLVDKLSKTFGWRFWEGGLPITIAFQNKVHLLAMTIFTCMP